MELSRKLCSDAHIEGRPEQFCCRINCRILPMAQTRSKGVLERGISSNLWRNTLSQIPSCLGKLAYLSSLRGPNSGRYEHHGLALLFGESETDKVLRKTHAETFTEWLNYSIE